MILKAMYTNGMLVTIKNVDKITIDSRLGVTRGRRESEKIMFEARYDELRFICLVESEDDIQIDYQPGEPRLTLGGPGPFVFSDAYPTESQGACDHEWLTDRTGPPQCGKCGLVDSRIERATVPFDDSAGQVEV